MVILVSLCITALTNAKSDSVDFDKAIHATFFQIDEGHSTSHQRVRHLRNGQAMIADVYNSCIIRAGVVSERRRAITYKTSPEWFCQSLRLLIELLYSMDHTRSKGPRTITDAGEETTEGNHSRQHQADHLAEASHSHAQTDRNLMPPPERPSGNRTSSSDGTQSRSSRKRPKKLLGLATAEVSTAEGDIVKSIAEGQLDPAIERDTEASK